LAVANRSSSWFGHDEHVGASGDPSYGNMLVQPMPNDSFPDGAFPTAGPLVTANRTLQAQMKFMFPK
jgi:hypothetical protein